MGAITDAERAQVRSTSPVGAKYDAPVDRESASEMLAKKAEAQMAQAGAPPASPPPAQPDARAASKESNPVKDAIFGTSRRQGMIEATAKSAARTVGNQIGRQILRGLMGGLFGGRRR